MGKYKNLTDFSEIIRYCQDELHMDWNNTCDILDSYRPCCEVKVYEYNIKDFEEGGDYYEIDEEGSALMLSFMKDMEYKNMSVIDE